MKMAMGEYTLFISEISATACPTDTEPASQAYARTPSSSAATMRAKITKKASWIIPSFACVSTISFFACRAFPISAGNRRSIRNTTISIRPRTRK